MLAPVAMVMILGSSARATAQDQADLRQQLDQLKERYEQMMQDLQQHIAALEQRRTVSTP